MLHRIRLISAISLAAVFVIAPITGLATQHRIRRPEVAPQKANPTPQVTPERAAEPTPTPVEEQANEAEGEGHEVESLKIDTNLVSVPVIITTREGNYIPDLRQEEFKLSEDGQEQQIAFFAAVSAPFHVVLLLDTSASADEKLGAIKRAATAFVEQLQAADRVKVISFDNDLRELCDFTNDRAVLRNAIYRTTSGTGTRLYDAMELALASIRTIKGRKAIVLFSDGVDFHSDRATFDSSLHGLDEEGVIVYPIRYETRAEAERIARGAVDDTTPQLPTIGVIRRAPSGTTAPTFPSDDPDSVPTGGQPRTTGPLGLPSAAEIMRRRRQSDPNAGRYPPDGRPPIGGPTGQPGGRSDPRDPLPDPRDERGSTFPSRRGTSRDGDSISVMLDELYRTADIYLGKLAEKSGGRMLRADTLSSLPDALARIAAELRTQYAIGYYPANKTRDGSYRIIKVTTTRKNTAVRARPGYRAPSGG